MSCFLNQSVAQVGGVSGVFASDDRLSRSQDQWTFAPPRQAGAWFSDGYLWPKARGVGGQFSSFGMFGDDAGIWGGPFELPGGNGWDGTGWDADGNAIQNCFVGTTRDQFGAVLGSVVVEGFVQSAGLSVSVGKTTSDTAGWYKLPTAYGVATAHKLTAIKAGAPDVAGSTDNNLLPSTTG